jgi:hypothetical protein
VLFREVIAWYPENYTKLINTLRWQDGELPIVKAGGAHSYHWGLKCKSRFELVRSCIDVLAQNFVREVPECRQ